MEVVTLGFQGGKICRWDCSAKEGSYIIKGSCLVREKWWRTPSPPSTSSTSKSARVDLSYLALACIEQRASR
jgi:hypothetical protein